MKITKLVTDKNQTIDGIATISQDLRFVEGGTAKTIQICLNGTAGVDDLALKLQNTKSLEVYMDNEDDKGEYLDDTILFNQAISISKNYVPKSIYITLN